MGPIAITVQNFASIPIGILIVWGIMKFTDSNFPSLTTKAKVLIQIGVSLFYTVLASMLFLNGTPKELAQQGIVLFCAVCFAQVWGYETVTKLTGIKDNNKPVGPQKPEPVVINVQPAPVFIVPPTPVNPTPVEPNADPKKPDDANVVYPPFGNQGVNTGRI